MAARSHRERRRPTRGAPTKQGRMNFDDTETLAPAVAPETSGERPQVRTVTSVSGGGPVDFGHAVQFEFAFDDGSHERFRAAGADFPKIVGTLRGYASITERAGRASPDRPVEVINPYQATDVRTDRVGPMVVARMPTTDGLPLLIAMDSSVAEKLMLGIERELARGTRR
jgi:hypothetical protein